MASRELSKNEKVNSLIFGAIVGVCTILISGVNLYFTHGVKDFVSYSVASGALRILGDIAIPVLFVYLLKRRIGTDWNFTRALKAIYTLLAASILVGSIGTTVVQKNVDKIYIEECYNNIINITIEHMEASAGDQGEQNEAEIDAKIELIEKNKAFALSDFSFRNAVAPIFISLLLNFIFALVLAMLFKDAPKKPTAIKQ